MASPVMQLRVEADVLARFDAWAKGRKQTRTQALRSLVEGAANASPSTKPSATAAAKARPVAVVEPAPVREPRRAAPVLPSRKTRVPCAMCADGGCPMHE